MTGGGFDYRGLIAIRDQMVVMEHGFKRWLEGFLVRQALIVLAKTKADTPVDTGWLHINWFVGNIRRIGDKLEILIVNEVEYASYVEYGHMNRSRTKWVDGFFMCTLAIDDVMRKMPAKFNREFAVWVRSLGADVR